jgi:hypothetical protein
MRKVLSAHKRSGGLRKRGLAAVVEGHLLQGRFDELLFQNAAG